MQNNNINNQNNNNQPRPPPNCANTFNNCNAASGLIRPAPWREFYNRQDMMIMNEIMRAANLFNTNNNETTTNQQQQQHCQTETSSASTTSHQPTATVPPGFVPMMVRPQMLPTQSAIHAINFGGAGDTAPLYNPEPPAGSMLLHNMLLVPVGQTAPMLESDLRRAQELYPPMNLAHQPQAQYTTGTHEAPPMNAWPQGRAPRQHEFFERSRNIIRSLQGSWSPVFGTYVNVPVHQISDSQVGETTTNVVPTHDSQEPYLDAEDANNEPMAESMEPLSSSGSDESGDEIGHFLEKKNLNNQFKDKNGPKPVEPPAFELKTVLTYSEVVRNLAISYPLSSTAPPNDQDPSNMPCDIAENRTGEPTKIDGFIEHTTGVDSQINELNPVEKSAPLELEEVLVLENGDAQQQLEVQAQEHDQWDQQQENQEYFLAEINDHEKEQPRVETEQQKNRRLQKEQKQREQDEKERQQEEQVKKERYHIELLHKKLIYNQKNQQKKQEQMLKEQQRIDKLEKKLAFKAAERQKEILQKEEQQKEQKLKDQQQRQEAKQQRGQRKKEKQAKKAQVQAKKQQKLQQQQQQPAAQAKSQKPRHVQQNKRSNNATTSTVVSGKTTAKTLINIGGGNSYPLPIDLNKKNTITASSVMLPTTTPSCAVTCVPNVKSPSPEEEIQTNQNLEKNQTDAVLPEPLEIQSNEAANIIGKKLIDNKNANDLESIPAAEQVSSIPAVEQSSSIPVVEQSSSIPVVELLSCNQAVEQPSSIQAMEQSSNSSSVEQSSSETAMKNPGNNMKRGKKRRRRRRRQCKTNSNRKREEQQPCEDNNLERGSFMQTLSTVFKNGFQLVVALLIILFYTIRNYFKSR